MTGDIVDVKAALTESLTELHLPSHVDRDDAKC